MLYKQKSFSIPKGSRDPADCSHGWTRDGYCIFCGTQVVVIKSEVQQALAGEGTDVQNRSNGPDQGE